jgi:Tfp pilus assembly protein PilF
MTDLSDRLKSALADRYTIERELGSGGMATVYLAQDLKHDRKVAVKVFRPELATVLGTERFFREIKITANLNHPHILALLDSGEADGFLYYVMPLVEGDSLRSRLNHEKQLSVDVAVNIAGQVASALSYAHSHDIVHRDIKPENILFQAGEVVVADFGIALAVDSAGGTRLTETGLSLGTPAYMSPEQATGVRDIDGRSDVYSLGCVLYEMLAGEPPYSAPTRQAVIAKKLSEPLPRVSVVRETVSPGVEQVLLKALAKNRVDRLATPEEFSKALTTASGTLPSRTPVIRRREVRIGVAASAVVILVIAAALLIPGASQGAFDPNRVLVVALEDESGLEEAKALGSWAQDYIIQVLSEAGFADVVDPLTALAVSQLVARADITGGTGSILALADEAQAGTVVSGRYHSEGDSIFVQIRIAGARDGSLLRTIGPVVGSIGARSKLVARLAQEVVAALATLLDQDLEAFEPAVRPATYEAYEAYVEGLEAFLRQDDDAEVARHFERAVAADPTFTRAALWAASSYKWAGYSHAEWSYYAKAGSLIAPLVESRAQLTRYERCRLDFVMALGPPLNPAAEYEAARCTAQEAPGSDVAKRELAILAYQLNRPGEAIEHLRELDPDRGYMKHCDCYWPVLTQSYHMLGDYVAELDAARQGRQRYPESLHYLYHEAIALAALGRLDDVAAMLEAMRSLPSQEALGRWLGQVAVSLRTHGGRVAAQEVFEESIAWYQSRPQDTEDSRAELAELVYQAERWDDAQRLYEGLAGEYAENTTYLAALGKLAARRGDRDEALRISEELRSVELALLEPRHTLWRAEIAALLGDRAGAMTLLQQAVGLGVNLGHGIWLHYDVELESLRDYPPFQEFLRPKG